MKNYYEILDVKFNSTQEEIKSKYIKKVKLFHPDLNPKKNSSYIFSLIKEAANTLLDAKKREIYNKKLIENKNNTPLEFFIEKNESIEGTIKTLNKTQLIICPKCQGLGCKYCKNKGYATKNKKVRITVPKNTKDGTVLKYKNTLIRIKVKKEKQLKIINGVVYAKIQIPPYLAILGGVIEVETLWGQSKIEIPPLTKTNQCFKLVNVGVLDKTTGAKGEQIVTIEIQTPEFISKSELELYKKIRKINNENKNKRNIQYNSG